MPLTQEQFQKARASGFSTEQIIDFEKRRSGDVSRETPKPQFSSPEEAAIATQKAAEEQKRAEFNARPAQVINRGIDLAMRPIENQTLAGIPDIVSRATTGKPYVSPDSQMRGVTDAIGIMAGAPGIAGNAIAKAIIPKVGAKLGQKILGGAASGAISGALVSPKDGSDIKARTGQAIGGGIVGGVIPAAGAAIKGIPKVIKNVRDYPANKVNSIRESFWNNYAPKEWKAYGKAIENLSKEGDGAVDGSKFIQNLEKNLFDRGILNSEGKIQKAFTPADSKLIRSYEKFYKKFAESKDGRISTRDIVDEYKNIKGSHVIKKSLSKRNDIQAANDFFNSASDQIDNKLFNTAKLRYRNFKENQQLIDESIDLYSPNMKTSKGEKFLTEGGMSSTAQGRKTAQMITDKTKVGLKGAKVITNINKVNPLNWIKK